MTLGECFKNSVQLLKNTADTPSLDARLLLQKACGCSMQDIIAHPEIELTEAQQQKAEQFIRERAAGIPVAYLTEQRAFYRSTFYTPRGVLIPQPDTEAVVEAAVQAIHQLAKNKENNALAGNLPEPSVLYILDVCAGTGCIGISVAKEIYRLFDEVHLYLTDISPIAYDCFTINAANLLQGTGVEVHRYCGDLFEPLRAENPMPTFDIIVSNPPYVKTSVIPTLPPEVQAEPHLALDGGPDGLDIIRRIQKEAPPFLKKGGTLSIEIPQNNYIVL